MVRRPRNPAVVTSDLLMTLLLPIAAIPVDGDLVEGAVELVRFLFEHALAMDLGEPEILLLLLARAQHLGAFHVEGMPEPHDLGDAHRLRGRQGRIVRAPDTPSKPRP